MDNKMHNMDLPDSEKDKEKMKPEEVILDLPEVKDIPGQEHVHPPNLREMADTTASSDDEEGKRVFGEDEDNFTDGTANEDTTVTKEEKEGLKKTEDMNTPDNQHLYGAELDDKDFEGEKLNEKTGDISGKDLDVPGEELDDEDEELGEEDEENNSYS